MDEFILTVANLHQFWPAARAISDELLRQQAEFAGAMLSVRAQRSLGHAAPPQPRCFARRARGD
jgi:hypothetical protein